MVFESIIMPHRMIINGLKDFLKLQDTESDNSEYDMLVIPPGLTIIIEE